MDASITVHCLSLLLLASTIGSSFGSNDTQSDEPREPRVNGRIVKLYSGAKPEPYLCRSEGFQADPTNCATFYRCVHERSGKFTIFRYQCAPGTVYDPEVETCNHPRNTRRSECGGMLKPTNNQVEISHTTDINEIDGAQSEVPRPISTRLPIYTERTTFKNPTANLENLATKIPWISTSNYSPSTLEVNQHKITNLPDTTTERRSFSPPQYQSVITQQPNAQNNDLCTSNGFMGDSENCRKFYRCVGNQRGGFIKYEFSCSELTVWDDEIQGCNHPWAVKRSKCGRSMTHYDTYKDKIASQKKDIDSTETPTTPEQMINNGEYGKKTNKTIQQQLQISHGLITAQTQTQISNSDHVIQNQTQINYGDKDSSVSKQNQTQISHGSAVSQTQTQIDHGNKGVQTQLQIDHSNDASQSQLQIQESTTVHHSQSDPPEPNNNGNSKCSESGFMGDANDCKKFYRCVDNGRGTFTRFEYSCGDGTVWDPEIEACNHAWAVKNCGAKYPLEPTKEEQTSSTATIATKTTDFYMQSTKTTQSYYPTSATQDSNVDDENDVGYGNQNNQETTPSSTTTMKTTTSIAPSTTTTTKKPSSIECTSSGFIGDANDCKLFYRCVDNGHGSFTKYEFQCGDGTLWDPEIEACNHAWAVKDCGGSSSSNNNSQTSSTTTTMKSTEYHTEPTKTTLSFTTTQIIDEGDDNDVGYGNQNNQETTPSSTTTMKTTSTTTKHSNGLSNECASNGFIGDANNCKIFYRCVDNGQGSFTKYEFKCGDGTVWDPEIEACNHAWAVKKCGGSSSDFGKEESTTKQETMPPNNLQTTVTLIQITTQPPMENDDYDIGYGSQMDEHSTSSTTTIRTTKLPEEQAGKPNKCNSSGFMGDENDCKKFYRCVDNGNNDYIRYDFTCGEGTVWDSEIEACNHAWAVKKCGGTSTVNAEGTSQSIPTTSFGDSSSTQTTEVIKTDKPVSETTSSTTISTSTGINASNNRCSKSGFMGDESDCKRFYRCVDNGDGSYTRYEFTCGDGTVWDSKIEACNHAWAVEKCGGIGESTQATEQITSQHPVLQDEDQDNGYGNQNFDNPETTQNPSTTSSESSITNSNETIYCSDSGFMGDKNDCKKFYRCVDDGKGGYDRYEFTCGEGTVWDDSIKSCNHAWTVKDCASGDGTTSVTNVISAQTTSSSVEPEDGQTQQSTEKTTTTIQAHQEVSGDKCLHDGFFGNKQDCKKFYRCVDDGKGGFTKYDFTCGDGTTWNQDKQVCDHASPDSSCNSASQEQIHLNDDMDTEISTSTSTATTPGRETENTQSTKKPEGQGTCESEGFYGNPSDCKKFYRCVDNGNGGYTKYDFNCGDGTVWNQDIQACDHESEDKICPSSTTSSQTSAGSSSSQPSNESHSESTTSAYSTTTTKQESTDQNGNECTAEGFFAHPNDCKKFIRCVHNGNGEYTRYEFSCGDGTVWVQEIQACDHDNDVNNCKIQSSSTYKPQNNEEHSSTASDSSAISSTESITPNKEDDEYDDTAKEPPHDETDDCTSEGYFPNKQDCKKFYRCVDNGNGGYTKYDFTCGEGTAWDSEQQTCNHINQVNSCSESVQQGNKDPQTTTSKNQGESSSSTTETSSSIEKTSTAASSESSDGSGSNNQNTCESEGYYGDSRDCTKFYRCVDNGKGSYTKYDFTCGEGTIWDQDITTCNHPQDVSNPSCSSEQGISDTSTASSETSSSSQTSSSTTESSSSQNTSDCSQESSKKPGNDNITCDKAGYYANPNDCKKFYRCVDWDGDGKKFSVFNFECGEGTIWDPALDTCNYEDSVYPRRDCSQTQSQNVGEETTTTTERTTTQQYTTEQTTTEKSTNEPTTEASTTEKTTTQETMSSEQTTQQPTTSEKTTTQESTTDEQTSTQQSTTSEQTTQESSTSEQTTTQQTATSEKTTTQEETTSEQTTTQQSATSEQTTTQQSTSSEQTTTEQSTNEQTTTQQSTTSERTTTQESTTSEQTTTTTEQTTTQESTTNQPTTQPITSEQPTTQQSTTSEQTTEETTTEETTDQSTTQASTTESNFTEESTTETSTTESSTTESSTTDSSTTGSSTTDSSTTDSSTTASSTSESSTTESSTTESSTTESSTTELSSSDKKCPETDDDQYLLVCPTSFKRHPKYCNMFYQCTEDDDTYEAKVATFKCPNNTIYDESKTQCVTEDKADKKCDGEIASKRRFKRLGAHFKDPIEADKGIQYSCSATGYFSFEKHSECSKGFFRCDRSKNGQLRGFVYQCPEGFIYWSISKRCERTESVRDCKKSINDWTGRWNIPIERKNVDRRS